MKKNTKKLTFEQRVGWFLLSGIIGFIGIVLTALFPGEPENQLGIILIIYMAMFVYSFFVKKTIYETFITYKK